MILRKFPAEFADLLTPRGVKILDGRRTDLAEEFAGLPTPFLLLNGLIRADYMEACQRLLDSKMYSHMRAVNVPIPGESITRMKLNYHEQLPKAMHLKTVFLSSRSSLSYTAAKEVGLLQMMQSESIASFAEAITGLTLHRDTSAQCILYEHSNYAGPHNDHHPENDYAKHGYVDFHITFSNRDVARQYLVCERDGHLSDMYSVASSGAISIYRLPFWHYTTPLIAKRNKEASARRWLLLSSIDIKT